MVAGPLAKDDYYLVSRIFGQCLVQQISPCFIFQKSCALAERHSYDSTPKLQSIILRPSSGQHLSLPIPATRRWAFKALYNN